VAESSFDAWTKFYRQDENAPNAIVSYYAKGALIALALDLQLRTQTGGKRSLDDVMRALWKRHGKTGIGVPEDGIFGIVEEIASDPSAEEGRRLADWLRRAVGGTADLPLARLLRPFGVNCRSDTSARAPVLGVRMASGPEAKIANVHDGGAAQAAGLSAGDVLVAFDGLRVAAGDVEDMLARRKAGETVRVHAFRRDELMEFDVTLAAPKADTMKLTLQDKPAPSLRTLRKGWLGL
jgi:predicted metalloprotease with PDZ domain